MGRNLHSALFHFCLYFQSNSNRFSSIECDYISSRECNANGICTWSSIGQTRSCIDNLSDYTERCRPLLSGMAVILFILNALNKCIVLPQWQWVVGANLSIAQTNTIRIRMIRFRCFRSLLCILVHVVCVCAFHFNKYWIFNIFNHLFSFSQLFYGVQVAAKSTKLRHTFIFFNCR